MSEQSERYTKAAKAFTATVNGVSEDAWENPTPCDDWVARDVIRHLADWIPGMIFGSAGLDVPTVPPVDESPAKTWDALHTALRATIENPEKCAIQFDGGMGPMKVEDAIDKFVTGDIFIHNWDLARATNQDDTLDAETCKAMYEGMLPMEEAIRGSGFFGPKVEVPADADHQTKFLAFTGRTP